MNSFFFLLFFDFFFFLFCSRFLLLSFFVCPLIFFSTGCNHLYSHEAILAYIQSHGPARRGRKPEVKCPLAGCQAIVTAGSLVPDKDTERALKRQQSRVADEEEEIEDV